MTKMTYVDAIDLAIVALGDNTEAVDKLTALKVQMSKKASSVNSKKRAEADARAERVYNALAEMDEPVTCSDLIKLTSDEEVASYSVARVSALLKKLGDRVNHEMKGKKSLYSIA